MVCFISRVEMDRSAPMNQFSSELPEAIWMLTVSTVQPVMTSVPLQYTRLSATSTARRSVLTGCVEFRRFRCLYSSALVGLSSGSVMS